MLNSIHLEEVRGIQKLTLDTPSLKKVKHRSTRSELYLNLVHPEQVERLDISNLKCIPLKKMKNLKYLCSPNLPLWSASEWSG